MIQLVTGDYSIFCALVEVLYRLLCRLAAEREKVRNLETVLRLKYLEGRLACKSLTRINAEDAKIEEVIDFLVVDLVHGHVDVILLLGLLKKASDTPNCYAIVLYSRNVQTAMMVCKCVTMPLHGVSLTRTRLSIHQDSRVEAIEHFGDNLINF